jgi:hypothetical protein
VNLIGKSELEESSPLMAMPQCQSMRNDESCIGVGILISINGISVRNGWFGPI